MKIIFATLLSALLLAAPIAVYSSSWETLEAKNLPVYTGDLKDPGVRCLN